MIFLAIMLVFGLLIREIVVRMINDSNAVIRFVGYLIGIISVFAGIGFALYFFGVVGRSI